MKSNMFLTNFQDTLPFISSVKGLPDLFQLDMQFATAVLHRMVDEISLEIVCYFPAYLYVFWKRVSLLLSFSAIIVVVN